MQRSTPPFLSFPTNMSIVASPCLLQICSTDAKQPIFNSLLEYRCLLPLAPASSRPARTEYTIVSGAAVPFHVVRKNWNPIAPQSWLGGNEKHGGNSQSPGKSAGGEESHQARMKMNGQKSSSNSNSSTYYRERSKRLPLPTATQTSNDLSKCWIKRLQETKPCRLVIRNAAEVVNWAETLEGGEAGKERKRRTHTHARTYTHTWTERAAALGAVAEWKAMGKSLKHVDK